MIDDGEIPPTSLSLSQSILYFADRTNALRTRRLGMLVTDIDIPQTNLNNTFQATQFALSFMDTNLKKFMEDNGLATEKAVREWARKDLDGAQSKIFDEVMAKDGFLL